MKILLIIIIAIIAWIIMFACYATYMRMKLSVVEHIDFTLPKSWKELTEKQFLFICQLFLMDNSQDEILAKCFLFFTKIKVIRKTSSGLWFCKSGGNNFTILDYEVQDFSQRLLFIVENISDVKPLSSIAGFSPVNHTFEGIPFKQWLAAENYYQAFLYTKDERFLNMLCAVIYSEGIEFDDSQTEKRARRFRKIPAVSRFSVFIVYMGFKEMLSRQFPYFFKKAIGEPTDRKEPPRMREHINNMLHVLDGGDATKTEQIFYIDSWLAFDKLNRKAKEIQEMEERLSKMKQK